MDVNLLHHRSSIFKYRPDVAQEEHLFYVFHIIFLVCFMNKTLVPFSGQIKWTTGCARDLSDIDFLTTVSNVRKIRTGL